MRSLIAAVAALMMSSCANEAPESVSSVQEAITTHCPGSSRVEGIDISKWQGNIDWPAVAASGKKFAIARATLGLTYVDPQFATNWAGIKANGLIRGAYHFFYPQVDAITQADSFVDTMGPLGVDDLPPTLDLEETPGMELPSPEMVRAQVRAFMDRVQMRTGRLPMIYTRQNVWDPRVGSDAYGDSLLWVAAYSATCPAVPNGWTKWNFHQYSETGTVAGIAERTDLDYFDGTYEDLKALAGGMTCTPSCDGNIVTSADCQTSDCADFGETCLADGSSARCISAHCPTTGEADVCVDARTRAHCVDGMLSNFAACPRGTACAAHDTTVQCSPLVLSDAGIEDPDPSTDGGTPTDGGAEDAGTYTPPGDTDPGCACSSTGKSSAQSTWIAALFGLFLMRRSRKNAR